MSATSWITIFAKQQDRYDNGLSRDHASHGCGEPLLVRDEDVQVLHGFKTAADARAYLDSELFTRDVVGGLAPLLSTAPDVRVYEEARQ